MKFDSLEVEEKALGSWSVFMCLYNIIEIAINCTGSKVMTTS